MENAASKENRVVDTGMGESLGASGNTLPWPRQAEDPYSDFSTIG